jgi:hypothetical protein
MAKMAREVAGRRAKRMSENKTRLVGTVEKNTGEELRINLVKWKKQIYFDIRIWFRGDDSEFHPSTRGIRLNCEFLPELIGLLQKANEELEEGVEIVQDGGP